MIPLLPYPDGMSLYTRQILQILNRKGIHAICNIDSTKLFSQMDKIRGETYNYLAMSKLFYTL